MLRFLVTIDIEADKWADDAEKQVFMKNAEDVIQNGLAKMTVPDWQATVVDAEEVEE